MRTKKWLTIAIVLLLTASMVGCAITIHKASPDNREIDQTDNDKSFNKASGSDEHTDPIDSDGEAAFFTDASEHQNIDNSDNPFIPSSERYGEGDFPDPSSLDYYEIYIDSATYLTNKLQEDYYALITASLFDIDDDGVQELFLLYLVPAGQDVTDMIIMDYDGSNVVYAFDFTNNEHREIGGYISPFGYPFITSDIYRSTESTTSYFYAEERLWEVSCNNGIAGFTQFFFSHYDELETVYELLGGEENAYILSPPIDTASFEAYSGYTSASAALKNAVANIRKTDKKPKNVPFVKTDEDNTLFLYKWISNGYLMSDCEVYHFCSDGTYRMGIATGGGMAQIGSYSCENGVLKLEREFNKSSWENDYDILYYNSTENIWVCPSRVSMSKQEYIDNSGNYSPGEFVPYRLSQDMTYFGGQMVLGSIGPAIYEPDAILSEDLMLSTVKTETFGGHTYELYTDSLSWTDAEKFCEKKGGHLIVITSEAEQSFVIQFSKDYKNLFWLGLYYDDDKSDWIWVNGEKLSYSNWSIGEPSSDKEQFSEFYGIARGSNEVGKWNDTYVIGTDLMISGSIPQFEISRFAA